MFRLIVLFAMLVLTPTMSHAAEATEAASAPAGLTWIDWLIILTYAVSTLVLGWWYGRRTRTRRCSLTWTWKGGCSDLNERNRG